MKLALLISLLFFCNILSQEDKNIFSRIDLSGGVLINSNRNLIHQYWEPGKGFFLLADSPFYLCNIEAGMFFIPYQHKSADIPGYKNYFFFLGFSKEIKLPLNLSIASGLRFGSEFFQFSDNSLSSYEALETEFAADIFASWNMHIYNSFHIIASADYLTIFTGRYIRLLFLSAGLGYYFDMPLWLREVLR